MPIIGKNVMKILIEMEMIVFENKSMCELQNK